MEEQARRLQIESTDKKSCIKALHDAYDRGLTDTISEMVSTHNKNVRKCEGGLIYDVNLLPDSQIMLYTDSGGLNWCFEKDLSVIEGLLDKRKNPYTTTALPASFIKLLEYFRDEIKSNRGEPVEQLDDVMEELFGGKKETVALRKETVMINEIDEILKDGLFNSGGDPYISVSQYLALDKKYKRPFIQDFTQPQLLAFLYGNKNIMIQVNGNEEYLIYFIVKAGLEWEKAEAPSISQEDRDVAGQYFRMYQGEALKWYFGNATGQ